MLRLELTSLSSKEGVMGKGQKEEENTTDEEGWSVRERDGGLAKEHREEHCVFCPYPVRPIPRVAARVSESRLAVARAG